MGEERLPIMRLILLTCLMAFSALHAQTNDAWKKLDFLLGNWTGVAGEKDTQLGSGQGDFSFQPELKDKIIVRRNNARYDSGVQHDDLMVIYLDTPNAAPGAIYFDSEGHVIRYALSFPSANRAVFESDGTQPGPKYRLTYWLEGGVLKGQFEIAAQGNDYKSYLSWGSKKR
jgi:hypothetical protein